MATLKFEDHIKGLTGQELYAIRNAILVALDSGDTTGVDRKELESALGKIERELQEQGWVLNEVRVFQECPKIPEAKEMISRTKNYLNANPHAEDWNIHGKAAEVASIGHNYTFHTHPRGTAEPSEADIRTTQNLKKDYLCIGLVPENKVICYDMRNMQVSCEHKV